MQKYAKICSDPISVSPMHSYAFICTKYANICKICKMSVSPMHSYAFICTKYANICKICKHEIYMQNMHSPLC